MNRFKTTRKYALDLDNQDPLNSFRKRFYLIPGKIYMDGNSLGLLSQDAEASLLKLLHQWKTLGINGWLQAEPPWFDYAEKLGDQMADLVGAMPEEVIVTSSTTINLHSLVGTFYHPAGNKNKILADELNFPSDIYALSTQIKLKGMDPKKNLVLVQSKDGRFIKEDDIVEMMNEEIALVVLPSVLYRSGQLLDMKYLSKEAKKKGINIGFDCSHSVGALPHYFDKWGVDFAFWCHYKYMNNGPGGVAGIYINKKHFNLPVALAGWWGYRKDKQFDMSLTFEKAKTAGGWQIGTPHLLSMAPLEGSLKIFQEAGIKKVREKSLHLTGYMIELLQQKGLTAKPYNYQIASPIKEKYRGGHIAVEHPEAARINKALKEKKGIIPDFRYPDIIRFAPIALYNNFEEVWQVVQALQEIIDNEDYKKYDKITDSVT
jgi:kynureninase